jgi:hypothetical protein
MHSFPWMWFLFGMVFWMCFIRPRRFGLCQGRSSGDAMRDRSDRQPRRASRTDLESALAERDELIAKLEERVRVLERIATDPAARLREEIDRLRDSPSERS